MTLDIDYGFRTGVELLLRTNTLLRSLICGPNESPPIFLFENPTTQLLRPNLILDPYIQLSNVQVQSRPKSAVTLKWQTNFSRLAISTVAHYAIFTTKLLKKLSVALSDFFETDKYNVKYKWNE